MAVLEYEEGRDNAADPVLAEFDEVEDTIEAQLTLIKEWGDFYAAGILQPDLLDRGKGFVSFLALGYELEVNPKLSIDTSIDISFADAEHMMTEVGISQQVSERSGFNAYSPSSGYKSSTLNLGLEYELAKNWSLISSMSYEYYGSAMADSPLIKDVGTRGNYDALAGVRFTF